MSWTLVTKTSKLLIAALALSINSLQSSLVQQTERSPGSKRDDNRTTCGRNKGLTSNFTRRTVRR